MALVDVIKMTMIAGVEREKSAGNNCKNIHWTGDCNIFLGGEVSTAFIRLTTTRWRHSSRYM